MRGKQINPSCQAKQEHDCHNKQAQRDAYRLMGTTQPPHLFRKYILNHPHVRAYSEDLDPVPSRERRVC